MARSSAPGICPPGPESWNPDPDSGPASCWGAPCGASCHTMTTTPDDPQPERRWVSLIDAAGALDGRAAGWLSARALAAMERLGVAGEARVRLVGDAEMAAAHERHCGVAGTTDVITFDLADGMSARGEPLDVDLLVCVDEARRQAASRGHSMERELLLYVVHGVLHCLGHDDHDEAAAAAMHAREDEVLEAIGVGVTYGRDAGGES